jgi:hypothetical protein
MLQSGVVMEACVPSTQEVKQEVREFKASLSYKVKSCLKKKKKKVTLKRI